MSFELKRYLIIGLAFLLVAKVMSCRLVEYTPVEIPSRCPPAETSERVSAAETEKFLKSWSAYLDEGLNADMPDKISLASGKPSEKVSWKVNFWLKSHCWNTDRFYYVEQRLRSIVHTLYLYKHTHEVAAVLKAQMENESDEGKRSAYQEMIDMQDKIANIEGISPEELEVAKGRESLIENILNGKIKYR